MSGWALSGLRGLVTLPAWSKAALLVAVDALCLPLCMLASVTLRVGTLDEALHTALAGQVVFAWMAIPVLAAAGLYRSVVRYLDLRVLARCSASLAAVVVLVYMLAQAADLTMLPRSSMLIFWFITFAYVLISRFLARALLWGALQRHGRPLVRTIIYGAGAAGAQLAHSMQFSPEYRAVCFVDDEPSLRGKKVAGLDVLPSDELRSAADKLAIDLVVVAVPSASPAVRRRIIELAEGTGLPVKTLPGLVDLVQGDVRVSDIREVALPDLLGREVVPPDAKLFSRNIRGKAVLVTGAGGSIGSELCRQIMSQRPAVLLLLDHSEFALYSIEQELRPQAQDIVLEAVLGSVLDEDLLLQLMHQHRVDTVYHAAAYKHVPLVEANVLRGITNNVFGSQVVARCAAAAGVSTCVLVSTDKAVRPTNVMGTTKRVAELIFQGAAAAPDSRTTFAMVRFGNVLGSSGSVVPLFKRQIQDGGPITITHPDIIRYFMLIPEAAQLVIQAGAMAQGGEVFVLDMGEPVRIVDLARTLIRLSGLTERTKSHPDGDIAIEFVGLRPGEKLYEELLIGDGVTPSQHPRIMCAHERMLENPVLEVLLTQLREASRAGDVAAAFEQLRLLVPEYQAQTPVAVQGQAAGAGAALEGEHSHPPVAGSVATAMG